MDVTSISDAERLEFIEVCRAVLLNASGGNALYAKSYAEAGIRIASEGAGREMLKVQALYILNNLAHWRGDEARKVKKIFRRWRK